MKLLGLIVLSVAALSACATKPIDTATAPSAPPSRVYAPELQVPGADKVQLTVARDTGFLAGGCMRAVCLDGKVVSAIGHGEKVIFYVPAGHHILGTGPNPGGKALCHVGSSSVRRETDVNAELGHPLKYRLAISANGEIAVMPTGF